MTTKEALTKLIDGNKRYVCAKTGCGDISEQRRQETSQKGQHPFALVITCSDSRVIPEEIFSCGIGELFIIRVIGNVISDTELASIQYGVSHLGVSAVIVLGHTHCGAIQATIEKEGHGFIKKATDVIKKAIGEEKDPDVAVVLNVNYSKNVILKELGVEKEKVIGAIYDIESGKVQFLD